MVFRSFLVRATRSIATMVDAKLEAVPVVDIDAAGRFKYILIKVWGKEKADGSEPSKMIVRGYTRAEWHGKTFSVCLLRYVEFSRQFFCLFNAFPADIYDEVSASISALGLDTECQGGGRIEHFPDKKFLKVYGHSTVGMDEIFLIQTACDLP